MFTTTGSTATIISWGTVTGGSAGTTGCLGSGSGPWTATFMTGATTAATAADLTSAINACSGASTTITATGNAVVSAAVAGTGSTLRWEPADNTNIFSWSAVTAGTNGTDSTSTFAYWSGSNYLSSAAVAANIVAAINANPTLQTLSSGVFATNGPSSNQVTVTANQSGTGGNSYTMSVTSFTAFTGTGTFTGGASSPTGTVQPNAFPAKYSFDTSGGGASCSDFIVYPTGTAGSTTQSTIVAYNNLYSGCSGSGTVPSVYWSYNTGSAYSVSTSPVLSLDGTQVAFIQSNGTSSSLVLLTWAANAADSINGPDAALTTAASAAAYQNCTAPCMFTMALSHNDTLSAPFYDYHGDALYVGDDSGYLHQFTGVLNGVPTESGGNWPVHLSTSNKLASRFTMARGMEARSSSVT